MSLPKPYYQDDAVTLYHGDCLDILRSNFDHNCDAVICDLPYGTTRCGWDSIIDLDLFWSRLHGIGGPPVIAFAQSPFDKVLGVSNLRGLRYELIWEKSHATGHLNAKKMPMKAHENILVFDGRVNVYNPIKTTGHDRKTATRHADGSEVYGKQAPGQPYDSTERFPRSVLRFASDKQRDALHPTQKPLALCEYLVQTYTNKGETVLDPCAGSGSIGLAAKNTGRKCVLIEREEKYCEIAARRMAQEVLAL